MEFRSRSASITVLPEHAEEFKAFMAKATRKHKKLNDAVGFSLNDAIREHPNWFDIFMYQPKVTRQPICFYHDPDWLVRENITHGFTLMKVPA